MFLYSLLAFDNPDSRRPKEPASMKDLDIWMNGKLVPSPRRSCRQQRRGVLRDQRVRGLRATGTPPTTRSIRSAAGAFRALQGIDEDDAVHDSYSDLDLYEAVRTVLSGNEVKEDITCTCART